MEDEKQWYFSQVKGSIDEEMVTEADLISTVEFNQDGRLLATGDKGGRIVIFRREENLSNCIQKPNYPYHKNYGSDTQNASQSNKILPCEYNVYATFQSHEPEFDYLKSLEIEEKINRIKWLAPRYPSYFLLTTNDKTIKLWKIMERDKKFEGFNVKDETGSFVTTADTSSNATTHHYNYPRRHIKSLIVPRIKSTELMVEASLKRIYANAHTYHINSISVNSDQETFLSADDLRINLWNLACDNVSFNIVDLKPQNMEDLSEVITSAEMHPTLCNLFIYATSKGLIRLCDMRDRALCDSHAKLFEDLKNSNGNNNSNSPLNNNNNTSSANFMSKSFFNEIISSVSDVRFAPHNQDRFATRDYLNIKIWDVRWEKEPWHTFPAMSEPMKNKLCALYENDCIFDKFELCWNGHDNGILTGSYNNLFRIFDLNNLTESTYQATVPDTNPIKFDLVRENDVHCFKTTHNNNNATFIGGPASKNVTGLGSRYFRPLRPIRIIPGYTPIVQNHVSVPLTLSQNPLTSAARKFQKRWFSNTSNSPEETTNNPDEMEININDMDTINDDEKTNPLSLMNSSSKNIYSARLDLSRQDSLDMDNENDLQPNNTYKSRKALSDTEGFPENSNIDYDFHQEYSNDFDDSEEFDSKSNNSDSETSTNNTSGGDNVYTSPTTYRDDHNSSFDEGKKRRNKTKRAKSSPITTTSTLSTLSGNTFEPNDSTITTSNVTKNRRQKARQRNKPQKVAKNSMGTTQSSFNRDSVLIPVPESQTLGIDSFDFGKKILHASWHPREDITAIATNNNLYLFQRI